MKNKLFHISFLLVIFTLFACKKDNVPILKGDIKGTISLYDAYGYTVPDKSGVQVQLTSKNIFMESSTDANGRYTFEDMPYGNYDLNLIKKNYIESKLDFRLGHVGGDAATITSQTMNEIPEYWFDIDSLFYDGSYKLDIFLHAYGVNKPFTNSWTYLHCFFSHSPDVSCDKFDNNFIDFLYQTSKNNQFEIYWMWWHNYYIFLNDYTGTIYCRVYPQTYCDEMWYDNGPGPHEVKNGTLGKPSEVFAFTLDKITRKF
jgi:hypothetical protein